MRLQRAKASDAQQQFLTDADASVAAVQARSQLAVFRARFLPRSNRAEADRSGRLSRARPLRDGAAAGFDLHRDRLAVRADRGFHRQLVDVGLEVLFLLPAVAIQPLAEISLAVKQADSDQRNSRSDALLMWSPASTPRPPE